MRFCIVNCYVNLWLIKLNVIIAKDLFNSNLIMIKKVGIYTILKFKRLIKKD